jgi:hypothetical protein
LRSPFVTKWHSFIAEDAPTRDPFWVISSAISLERQTAVRHYIEHLDIVIKASIPDAEDQTAALKHDRQGLGFSRVTRRKVKSVEGRVKNQREKGSEQFAGA